MIALDTSVLVAALVESEPFHQQCKKLVVGGSFSIYSHGLVETFSTLTSGKILPRPSAADAFKVLNTSIKPRACVHYLQDDSILLAFEQAELRGVRGGAIFDYLHLVAARQHGVERLYTLNMRHFKSFWRPGDPHIEHPGS